MSAYWARYAGIVQSHLGLISPYDDAPLAQLVSEGPLPDIPQRSPSSPHSLSSYCLSDAPNDDLPTEVATPLPRIYGQGHHATRISGSSCSGPCLKFWPRGRSVNDLGCCQAQQYRARNTVGGKLILLPRRGSCSILMALTIVNQSNYIQLGASFD